MRFARLFLAATLLLACENQIVGGPVPPVLDPVTCPLHGSACEPGGAACSVTVDACGASVTAHPSCFEGNWALPVVGCAVPAAAPCSPAGTWLIGGLDEMSVLDFVVQVETGGAGLVVFSPALGAGSTASFDANTCDLTLADAEYDSCYEYGDQTFCTYSHDETHIFLTNPPTATYQFKCWGECGDGPVLDATVQKL